MTRCALPEPWSRIRLVIWQPEGFVGGMAEAIEGYYHGFAALGCDIEIKHRAFSSHGINILFYAQKLSEDHLVPANTIIFNSEQISDDPAVNAARFVIWDRFFRLMNRLPVWDYSLKNLDRLRTLIGHDQLQYVPVGYMPQLARIEPAPVQDIDVLFYGTPSERRMAVLAAIGDSGLRAIHIQSAWGAERDALIARAKVVLNTHYHDTKVFEIVRASYLLANGKAVVGECDEETAIEDDIRDAIAAAPYDRLAETCIALATDDRKRKMLEERGQALFRRRDQAEILRQAVLAFSARHDKFANPGIATMSHPQQLFFVQSIKNFMPQYFNGTDVLEIGSLNINGSVRTFFADCRYIGLDVGEGPDVDVVCPGEHFGGRADTFDAVLSCEAMEHNPGWTKTWLNMIRLLRPDGLMIMTCATTGRMRHGTVESKPYDSPLTTALGQDYYRNLEKADFLDLVNLDRWFSVWTFEQDLETRDLYFFGLAEGAPEPTKAAARMLKTGLAEHYHRKNILGIY
jgi:SAM-dependent methyltransferase